MHTTIRLAAPTRRLFLQSARRLLLTIGPVARRVEPVAAQSFYLFEKSIRDLQAVNSRTRQLGYDVRTSGASPDEIGGIYLHRREDPVSATGPRACLLAAIWLYNPRRSPREGVVITRFLRLCAGMVLVAAVAPGVSAQSNSSIAGVVRDTSGGVLPGVTVEASSPVLIEKARTAFTDSAGQYKIIDLVPGVYTVTFTLAGFTTIKREGIELTSSFTANVNADLRVGALEETITVSGQSPTVDVQNVTQTRVMTRDVIDAIPTGMKSTGQIGTLIPGVTTTTQDVGGSQFSGQGLAIHGSRLNEVASLYDGMPFNVGQGRGGQFVAITTNDGTVQEMAVETGGLSAEAEVGGIRFNMVPRDGGNTFKGIFSGAYTDHNLQSDNLNDSLRARGLTSATTVRKVFDVNPSYGGPFVRDRVWFWGSYRNWGTMQTLAGIYYNLTPQGSAYTPDLSRPADSQEFNQNASLRLTWQATPRNKVSAQYQSAYQRRPYYGYSLGQLTSAPEAIYFSKSIPMYQAQTSWSSPVTSRLLLQAGALYNNKNYWTVPQPDNPPDQIPYTDLGAGFTWGNYAGTYGNNQGKNFNARFSASYVTGSHSFKTGVTFMRLWADTGANVVNNGMTLQLLNSVPRQVTVWATPFEFYENMNQDWGVFAQDQWTVGRTTINLGVRFDHLENQVPAQTLGPGPQVPVRNISFPEINGVPDWTNVTPRFGIAHDLFGNGRTALKFNIGKYLAAPNPISFSRVANPAGALVQSATRTWSDANGDFAPQVSELGPISNPNFGSTVSSTRYAPDALTNRSFNWELGAQLQQELADRVSVNLAYYRRWYGNLLVTDNAALRPTDYSPYSVTAPVDSRLPGGGGYAITGLYDPKAIVAADNVIDQASKYGEASEVYNGFDLTGSVRLPRGVILSGGASIGRVETNYCFVTSSPQGTGLPPSQGATTAAGLLYCNVKPPFQPNVKAIGVYPLKWGVSVAGTFQSVPGPMITAASTYTSAQIAPSLGRNLATGANGIATVQLIKPGTMYDERLYQLDLRVSKGFRMARARLQANIDLYNALNAGSVLTINTTYGGNWLRPTSVLQGRLLKFGAQVDF
jgi:hypothetical protein